MITCGFHNLWSERHPRGVHRQKTIPLYGMLALAVLGLLSISPAVSAEVLTGGLPLTTVQSGTVSGGVYIGAYQPIPWSNQLNTSGVKVFNQSFTLPAFTEIQWARLYAVIYAAGSDARAGYATISFDRDGDGTYDILLGSEDLNMAASSAPDVYVVNDHVNRQYSDYMIWYNVTDQIHNRTVNARIQTGNLSGSTFDGRIKMFTLVAAYNSSSGNQVTYFINNGHAYQSSSGSAGQTTFGTGGLPAGWSDATLSNVMLSSKDATYTFNGTTLTGANPVSPYGSFGYNTWNVTNSLPLGNDSIFVYTHATSTSFKTPLAVLTVTYLPTASPVAGFSANATTGTVPLPVRFTDASTGSPTSWNWSFGDGNTSTSQNPSHTYAIPGNYTVNLTVANSAGSNTLQKSGYIRATIGGDYDLSIAGTVSPRGSAVFAKENNTVRIIVKNTGNLATPVSQLELRSSDGFTGRAAVPSLHTGSTADLSIVDTTIRSTAGSTVSYTATVDPDDTITETSEANNALSSSGYTVLYNGYKGKTYWEGGSNVTTYRALDIPGGLVYSSGDSVYKSGSDSWTSYTVTWPAGDLAIPEGSTIKEARLYVPYTWDNSNQAPENVHIDFNGNRTSYEKWYSDRSNFGGYASTVYGLLTYDVTDGFRTNSANSAVFSRDTSGTSISPDGFTLAVVYENANATRKQIFLNEEFDLLGADETNYGTTPEEATAYVPFTGQTIDTSHVSRADLITFVPSGNGPEGNLLFNGNLLAGSVWNYGDSQVAVNVTEVTGYIASAENRAGIQSSAGSTPLMAAAHEFLVIEYNNVVTSAPEAAFTANVTSGTAPLAVRFKDMSNGPGITAWQWDFGDGSTGTGPRPVHSYTTPGNYTVNLTATSAYGTGTLRKTGYITVSLGAPAAGFIANVTAGNTPLPVRFTDTSTGNNITSWLWDFGDNTTATEQNPVHTYTLAGLYTVKLTASNAAGSNTATKSNYINVSAYNVQENSFAFAGIQVSGTGSDQTVTINATQANTTGTIVNVTCCGSNWSYLEIRMNATPTNTTTEITGTVDTVKAVTEPVTVPIESVGTPTVRIELVLDEMPNATASITETITRDPNATSRSSFSAAASGNGKQIDAIAYTLSVTKTDLENRVDNSSGIILNATITMAVNASWVTSHGGTGSIVIMRRADTGTTQFLTTRLAGTDSSGNYVFTAVSPGLSTFILSSVSATSSSGSDSSSSSGSSGGSSSGSSGTTAKNFVGAVYDFLSSPLSMVASDSTVTYVSGKGAAESGWILASGLTAMPDAKASWSVEVTDDPDGGGKITTAILQSVPDDTLGKFRPALAKKNLDIESVAYGMEITKSGIPGTRDAAITMTASPAWVINTSGVGMIRILRLADDGTPQVLTAGFTGYDMDTGYLTFQAQSPDGLCTFALASVKPGSGIDRVSEPGVIPAGTQNGTALPVSNAFPLLAVVVILLLIIGAGVVAMVYSRRNNLAPCEKNDDDGWDPDDSRSDKG